MTGDLYINGKDAYDTWGLSLSDGSFFDLIAPAPTKDVIESKSRLEHGKRVITDSVKADERTLNLDIHMSAKDADALLANYTALCEDVLLGGLFHIRTKYQDDVEFHLLYQQCSSTSGVVDGIIKLTIKCNEYDPSNREVTVNTNETLGLE